MISPGLLPFSLALETEIVEEDSNCSVGIERDVRSLVYQEVVPGPLSDNVEPVYESRLSPSILKRLRKSRLCQSCCMILIARRLPCAADALWLEMHGTTYIAAIYIERNQNVQRTAQIHHLSGPASSAGDELG